MFICFLPRNLRRFCQINDDWMTKDPSWCHDVKNLWDHLMICIVNVSIQIYMWLFTRLKVSGFCILLVGNIDVITQVWDIIIHFKTSMASALKFVNGLVISSDTLQWIRLLFYFRITLIHVDKRVLDWKIFFTIQIVAKSMGVTGST